LKSSTGRNLTEEEIAGWSISQTQLTEETGFSGTPFGKGNQEQGSDSKEDVSYRLGRYEIIQKPSGQMWWKTPSGHTGLRVGKSIIAGDILFMEVGCPVKLPALPQEASSRLQQEKPHYILRRFLRRRVKAWNGNHMGPASKTKAGGKLKLSNQT